MYVQHYRHIITEDLRIITIPSFEKLLVKVEISGNAGPSIGKDVKIKS